MSEAGNGKWSISVVGPEEAATRGIFSRGSTPMERSSVPVDRLRSEVDSFMRGLGEMFAGAPHEVAGDFYLDEVSVSAEVSAKGTLSLLGTGGELSGSGGVSFTLRRRVVSESG